MKIKILFDSNKMDPGFFTGWGISYLIEDKILFDTGEKAAFLFNNMYQVGVKADDIETIVISHDHFDHTNGLWDLLHQKQGIDLYICPGFSQQFKGKAKTYRCNVKEVDSFMRITNDIYTTGQIEGINGLDLIAEQALTLHTEKGLTIISGCAHPGIIKIVEYVKDQIDGNIHLVMGGFHLLDESVKKIRQVNDRLKQLGVQNLGPSHCTGENAEKIFRESYKEHYIDIIVGQTIEV